MTATRAQLGKVESSFAEAYAERGRLSAVLDEAKEQHQAERSNLNMRLDALQSRATTAERLLSEARQNLIARTEEVRAFDRKSVEATISRNNSEKQLAQIEAAHEARERQIKDHEQARTALTERNNALTKTLKVRETALARFEEKIAALTERNGHLEADIQVTRANIEKRVEDLSSALQREAGSALLSKVRWRRPARTILACKAKSGLCDPRYGGSSARGVAHTTDRGGQ